MGKQILITAGGTSEPIDNIRSITNKGTGKLGSLIADELARFEDVEKIIYLHGKGSFLPAADKAELIEIETTEELKHTVKKLTAQYQIDAAIHSMAVSDYTVSAVVSAKQPSMDLRNQYRKLPSSIDKPMVVLRPTPKILLMFRELLPKATIVGFKLLDGVSRDELMDTAYQLLKKNGCDYVLANDYRTVAAGKHTGFLMDKNKHIQTFSGKEAIAKGIARAVMEMEIMK